jgi:hypothetical protein
MTRGDIVYCHSEIDGEKNHPYLITEVSEDGTYIRVLLITHNDGVYGLGSKMKLHSTDIPGMYLKYSFLGTRSKLISVSSCIISFDKVKISAGLKEKLKEYGHNI